MKMLYLSSLLFLTFQILSGQNQVPSDLKKSSLIIIKYNYNDWDNQFIDSTTNQWVLNRYGKDVLYKNYKEAFDESVKVFDDHDIKYTICDSKKCINENDFDYLFDYKQKIVDNHESIVADKHLGGFFFKNLKTNKKYEPIIENKKYIRKVIKNAL